MAATNTARGGRLGRAGGRALRPQGARGRPGPGGGAGRGGSWREELERERGRRGKLPKGWEGRAGLGVSGGERERRRPEHATPVAWWGCSRLHCVGCEALPRLMGAGILL